MLLKHNVKSDSASHGCSTLDLSTCWSTPRRAISWPSSNNTLRRPL